MTQRVDGVTRSASHSPFLAGVRAALPLWLGITPYGLAFGLLGPAAGLGAWGALAMSGIVFAGSAQFVCLGLLAGGAAYPLIVLTTLFVNLRHLLYGASIAPYLGRLRTGWRALVSFFLADETYAVAIDRFRRGGAEDGRSFYLGVALTVYVDWVLSTALGLILGGLVPEPGALGLDFALPATFIGLLVPQLHGRGAWVALAVAGVGVLLGGGLPGGLGILVATIAGATAGWGVGEWRSRS